MEFDVKLPTTTQATIFAATCGKYDEDIDFVDGRRTVDAKSLLGIMTVTVGKMCKVRIHTDDEVVIDGFQKDIKEWIVKENACY